MKKKTKSYLVEKPTSYLEKKCLGNPYKPFENEFLSNELELRNELANKYNQRKRLKSFQPESSEIYSHDQARNGFYCEHDLSKQTFISSDKKNMVVYNSGYMRDSYNLQRDSLMCNKNWNIRPLPTHSPKTLEDMLAYYKKLHSSGCELSKEEENKLIERIKHIEELLLVELLNQKEALDKEVARNEKLYIQHAKEQFEKIAHERTEILPMQLNDSEDNDFLENNKIVIKKLKPHTPDQNEIKDIEAPIKVATKKRRTKKSLKNENVIEIEKDSILNLPLSETNKNIKDEHITHPFEALINKKKELKDKINSEKIKNEKSKNVKEDSDEKAKKYTSVLGLLINKKTQLKDKNNSKKIKEKKTQQIEEMSNEQIKKQVHILELITNKKNQLKNKINSKKEKSEKVKENSDNQAKKQSHFFYLIVNKKNKFKNNLNSKKNRDEIKEKNRKNIPILETIANKKNEIKDKINSKKVQKEMEKEIIENLKNNEDNPSK
ncbi:MAG: hypothetical protein ACRC42_04860 [Mycoplasma sp.]